MATRVEHGFVAIADLSGFTEFMSKTELEHGPLVTAALLEAVILHMAPPFEIQEVEGDAVFAVGPDRALLRPVTVLDVLDAAYVAFRTKHRDMQIRTTCPCNACRAIPSLRLKFVLHYGTWLRHSVGGRGQLAGPDVILAHRLLKNHVETPREYLLLSEAAASEIELDSNTAGLTLHVERYDHYGNVRCFVGDLEPAWRYAVETSIVRIPPEDELGRFEAHLPVSPSIAWDWLLAPDRLVQWWTDVARVAQDTPGRPGPGTVSHCHHGDGSFSAQRIVDWRPFESLGSEWDFEGVRARQVFELVPEPSGCHITSIWGTVPGAASNATLRANFGSLVPVLRAEVARLERVVREHAGAASG